MLRGGSGLARLFSTEGTGLLDSGTKDFFFRTLGTSVASGLGGTALQNQVAQEKGEGACRERYLTKWC